jgi:hypothetical protein
VGNDGRQHQGPFPTTGPHGEIISQMWRRLTSKSTNRHFPLDVEDIPFKETCL